jgi:L-asparaginase II
MSLRVEITRGSLVESVHRVHVAVVDRSGRLVASSGRPDLVTFWRSAAKPFQAMAMVEDGAARRFGFDRRELALACASHSSEPVHLEVTDGMLRKVGLGEGALACGPHPPLSPVIAERVIRSGLVQSPRWSNCSGKHTGMLALALQHGWPTAGYQVEGHPVQQRILEDVARWTGLRAGQLGRGVDGCTAVAFALPLRAMARAYARFGTSTEPSATSLRQAMAAHPELIAGQGRLCTDLSMATGGAVIAKVGADGIYCATVPAAGLGIALKVEDGDMDVSPAALVAVLTGLAGERELPFDPAALPDTVRRHAGIPILNTRGAETGERRVRGALVFAARARGKAVAGARR